VKLLFRRGQRRQVTVNGAKKTSSELSGLMTAVLFSPDDLYLIKEGPAARRRLMDNAICQLRPGYAGILTDFNRLYENKTRILKDWREKPSLLHTLDEFSDGLARCSARIIRYRASFVERLAETAGPIHGDFSGGREALGLQYKTVSTVNDPFASVEQIYYQICDHQERHRQAELEVCQCLTGAHKDDIEITVDGMAARSFASQGQTRTAALSIKLAEREIFKVETGEYPVLLLDDVLSELDGTRQEFVLNRIGGGQTLITCCEDDQIRRRTGGRVFTVENGHIRQET
jgi:DNA replication and repair protein RecF